MESNREQKVDIPSMLVGTAVAWVICILVTFFVGGPRDILDGRKAFKWQKHECVTMHSEAMESEEPTALVAVRYEYAGNVYETTRTVTFDSEEALQRNLQLFLKPKEIIGCRINPDDPDEMMLEKEYQSFGTFYLLSTFITGLCFVIAFVWSLWLLVKNRPLGVRLGSCLNRVVLFTASFLILVFCPIASFTGFVDAYHALPSLLWKKVDATIIANKMVEFREGKSWSRRRDLRYEYEFDSQKHVGTRMTLSEEESSLLLPKRLRKLKEGAETYCYVDPRSPEQAVLHRGLVSLILGPPLVLLLAVGSGFGVWIAIRGDKSDSPPSPSLPEEKPSPIPELPFHLQFDLSRKTRLVFLLKMWLPFIPFFLGILLAPLFIDFSWWAVLVPLVCFWVTRKFWFQLLGIILFGAAEVDIEVHEDGLAPLFGNQRWLLYLDCIERIEQIIPGIWTIKHRANVAVHIPKSAITEDQMQYIINQVHEGRTPEGIRKIVERSNKKNDPNS